MTYLGKSLSLLAMLVFVAACSSSNTEKTETTDTDSTAQTATADPVETKGLINPNLATEAELSEAGLATEVVSEIMAQRPFLTMTDLDVLLAQTYSDSERATLYAMLFVPMNLNTTAEEDFKIIPGVGDRMAHEFEEYRPYAKLAQFRKEIGKYVDEAEVARLEQYIFVPVELNTASEEDILALPGVGKRMAHEFEEYRPYSSMEQFRKEISKYVDDKELARLERFVYLNAAE